MKINLSFFYKIKKHCSVKHIIVGCFSLLILCFLYFRDKQSFGMVDMAYVYEHAQVFKAIREQQNSFETLWKENAIEEKEKLVEEDKALSKKKARMKKIAFEKEVNKLKERILNFQNQQMARLDLIRYQTSQVQQQVVQTIQPMIKQIAQESNLDFVFSSSNALYYSDAVDITTELIDDLDEAFEDGQLPNIQINFEEGV
ncbi:MAG: OmpH family outer membrane protein [Alphaproteobacteria bacterium]|nr:OmpH family outer membrane protein [Alphaproteobacteria bacterium]